MAETPEYERELLSLESNSFSRKANAYPGRERRFSAQHKIFNPEEDFISALGSCIKERLVVVHANL